MESVVGSTRCASAPLTLADFQFDLPAELIAQQPADERDQARLMVLDRADGALTHSRVRALDEHLRPGDLLVVNDTQVIPARLSARAATGGAVELLLIRPECSAPPRETWLCLGKPARRLRPGASFDLPSGAHAVVDAVQGEGCYRVAFDTDVAALLARYGEIPLPPYIHRPQGPLPSDRSRYQTIFAAHPGAIAAPTAGLHFTNALLGALTARGVRLARLTLHVGPGTFLPLRSDDLTAHVMDPEWCEIPFATARAIQDARARGDRIVAVGTTTTRALESAAGTDGSIHAGACWADRFIIPGHRFRVVDALFTNFHLPGSTLLLLVSAFAGRERILAAYAEAVRQRYRFYSYGDAMLIQ